MHFLTLAEYRNTPHSKDSQTRVQERARETLLLSLFQCCCRLLDGMATSDARKLHNCSGNPLASIYYTAFFPSTKLLAPGLPSILHFTSLNNKIVFCYFADVSNQHIWAASQARQLQVQHCWSLTELFAPDGQFMRCYFKFTHMVPQCRRSVTNFKGWCPVSWPFEQYAHLCIQKVNRAVTVRQGME